MTDSRDPAQHIPLAPHSFQILLSLLDTDRHGYSIIKDIEEKSGGSILLGTSTVYAAIKRMVKDGLLVEAPTPRASASSGPKRRYYAITPFGRRVARAEGERISELNDMVSGSSLMRGPGSLAKGEVSS